MEWLFEMFPQLQHFGAGVFIPLVLFGGVGILGQWSLYDKCGQPGIDCIIPIKNVITFLKIVGRPASHGIWVMLPPPIIAAAILFIDNTMLSYGLAAAVGLPWIFFMTRVYIDLCQSFGHYKITDYILVIVFNGFYVMHLGLSYSEKYKGPAYAKRNQKDSKKKMKSQLA